MTKSNLLLARRAAVFCWIAVSSPRRRLSEPEADPAKKQNLCALGVSVVKNIFKLRQTMPTDVLPHWSRCELKPSLNFVQVIFLI
jgi:hypothetical protein